jgi:hypothetical protein
MHARAALRRRAVRSTGSIRDSQLEVRSRPYFFVLPGLWVSGQNTIMVFHPIVEFAPPGGDQIVFASQLSDTKSFIVGQSIEVEYDPHDPTRAEVLGVWARRPRTLRLYVALFCGLLLLTTLVWAQLLLRSIG